jgi:hypothetical protein
MLHVTDRKKWNRTKGWLAFGCWAVAVGAVGFDESTTSTREPRYDIAIVALSLCAGLCISIARKR